jgi:hypothetical protein
MTQDNKLNRRNFLKTSATGAAGLSLLASAAANLKALPPAALPPSISPRQTIPLNHGWLFSLRKPKPVHFPSPQRYLRPVNNRGGISGPPGPPSN